MVEGRKTMMHWFCCFAVVAACETALMLLCLISAKWSGAGFGWWFLSLLCIPWQWIVMLIALVFRLVKKCRVYVGYMAIVNAAMIVLLIYVVTPLSDRWKENWWETEVARIIEKQYREGFNVEFVGFADDEMARITVRRKHYGAIVDTPPFRTAWTPLSIRYGYLVDSLSVEPLLDRQAGTYYVGIHSLRTYCEWRFDVAGESFTVTDVEFGVKPQYSMFSPGYGSRIEKYRIDDSIYTRTDDGHDLEPPKLVR